MKSNIFWNDCFSITLIKNQSLLYYNYIYINSFFFLNTDNNTEKPNYLHLFMY